MQPINWASIVQLSHSPAKLVLPFFYSPYPIILSSFSHSCGCSLSRTQHNGSRISKVWSPSGVHWVGVHRSGVHPGMPIYIIFLLKGHIYVLLRHHLGRTKQIVVGHLFVLTVKWFRTRKFWSANVRGLTVIFSPAIYPESIIPEASI